MFEEIAVSLGEGGLDPDNGWWYCYACWESWTMDPTACTASPPQPLHVAAEAAPQATPAEGSGGGNDNADGGEEGGVGVGDRGTEP